MAESTNTLTYSDLKVEAALALGWSRTSTDWSTNEADDVARVVDAGYRQFLTPPPVQDPRTGRLRVHHWFFLRTVAATITTAEDDWDYDLPEDFGHITANVVTIQDDAEAYPAIEIVGESAIRRLRQADHTTTGIPTKAAIRPKAFTGATTSTRYEMIFWGTWDGEYIAEYSYAPIPDKMVAATAEYPRGMATHAETLKASIWAVAELEFDHRRGVHWTHFMDRLVASVEVDKQLEPSLIGYMADGSDYQRAREPHMGDYTVTYTPP